MAFAHKVRDLVTRKKPGVANEAAAADSGDDAASPPAVSAPAAVSAASVAGDPATLDSAAQRVSALLHRLLPAWPPKPAAAEIKAPAPGRESPQRKTPAPAAADEVAAALADDSAITMMDLAELDLERTAEAETVTVETETAAPGDDNAGAAATAADTTASEGGGDDNSDDGSDDNGGDDDNMTAAHEACGEVPDDPRVAPF